MLLNIGAILSSLAVAVACGKLLEKVKNLEDTIKEHTKDEKEFFQLIMKMTEGFATLKETVVKHSKALDEHDKRLQQLERR